MQNRKTPTTLVWMAGILILVGGFTLVRAFGSRRAYVNEQLPTATSTTPNDTNGYSTTSNPTLPPTATPVVGYGRVSQRFGQTITFKDLSIKALSVVEDSRCPIDVQCIQAGTVRVNLQIVSVAGTSTQTIQLGKAITTETEKITFVSVTPDKKSTTSITSSNYVFVFDVIKPNATTPTPVTAGKCYVGGCSGQLCTDNPAAISTCEYSPTYACYKTAICERQSSGQCGFTTTPALSMCLKNPPQGVAQ